MRVKERKSKKLKEIFCFEKIFAIQTSFNYPRVTVFLLTQMKAIQKQFFFSFFFFQIVEGLFLA